MPPWLSAQAAIVAIAFGLLLWRETRRPLRDRVERRLVHTVRNVAVGLVSAAAVHLIETPVILPFAALVESEGIGLLRLVALPWWLDVLVACVLMDYTLYVWHVLAHKVPILWRFHLVHHADLDLDASTALRFHFGELLISIPWRVAQIALIGTTPHALVVWQTATLASILFHHSNAELPLRLERALSWMIVTPRMHGIHHSVEERHVNSNWSSGLALWDRVHGTFQLDVAPPDIVIGVQEYRVPRQVSFRRMLAFPFVNHGRKHRP